MISDKRERNCIGHTMSERLFESDKKTPLRLLVIRNGMPTLYLFLFSVFGNVENYSQFAHKRNNLRVTAAYKRQRKPGWRNASRNDQCVYGNLNYKSRGYAQT